MQKLWHLVLLTTVLMLFVALPTALALDQRSGSVIMIAADETVADDLFVVGDTVTIDGTVHGDVFAAAATIVVNGTIDGNLFAAGRVVEVRGLVAGSTFAAGHSVLVTGRVDRNLITAAAGATLNPGATVGHNWLGAADAMLVRGSVGRDVIAGAGRLQIAGHVGQQVRAGVNELRIASTAVVEGPIWYESDRPAEIAPEAQVGEVIYQPAPVRTWSQGRWYANPWRVAAKFVGFLLAGWVVLYLFPRLRDRFPGVILAKPWQAPLVGLLALIVLPVATITLWLTVIGLPLGTLILLSLLPLVYLGQILVSFSVGQLLSTRLTALENLRWPLLFLVGAVVTTVLIELPWLGGALGAVAVFYGLGGLFFILMQREQAA